MLLTGAHDLLTVRESILGPPLQPLSHHALFFFVLLLAWIVVQRYSASVDEVRALNAGLAQRLNEREAQLSQTFETLRAQREEQAALQERQRIMRDIHDGVGSQLVGLLSLVRQAESDRPVLEQHVSSALDELRLAVDSQQPVHGDLTIVLATLRYRLQSRLQAAGIAIVWDVSPLPHLGNLSPQAVLQIQRILLEAFTNVIRHSQAKTVTVSASHLGATDLGSCCQWRTMAWGFPRRLTRGATGCRTCGCGPKRSAPALRSRRPCVGHTRRARMADGPSRWRARVVRVASRMN